MKCTPDLTGKSGIMSLYHLKFRNILRRINSTHEYWVQLERSQVYNFQKKSFTFN